MNTKSVIILYAVSALSVALSAQPQQAPAPSGERKHEARDKVESERIAFITSRLELTSEEAQKFWPVYNQYKSDLRQLHESGNPRKDVKKLEEMGDQEAEELIQNRLLTEQKELDLRKRYYELFKAVLPVKKVAKLMYSEKEFRKEHRQDMREHRKEMHEQH